ncbi:MAG: Hpt domain-containing protein, partial [Chlorobiaceae bacterium]|nr:Hpt domain-containing protein [Chlorobiaceae bacterium]
LHTPSDMRKTIDESDFASLRSLSHKLKGSSALIGLDKIRKAAEELEMECREEKRDNLESLVATITALLGELSLAYHKDMEK